MYPQNSYYGHRQVLQRYTRTSLPLPIPGILQHGWSLKFPADESITKLGLKTFVWSKRILNIGSELGFRGSCEAIGSPMIYLPPPQFRQKPEPESLIYFPFHGWEGGELDEKINLLLPDLLRLKSEGFKSITVSLYWLEFTDKSLTSLLESQGFKVICFGHRDNDPRFLLKLSEKLCKFEFAASNRFATCALYSMLLGLKFFLHGRVTGIKGSEDPSGSAFMAYQSKEFPNLYSRSFDSLWSQRIVIEELGLDQKRTPEELKELFCWNLRRLPQNLYFRLRKRCPNLIP